MSIYYTNKMNRIWLFILLFRLSICEGRSTYEQIVHNKKSIDSKYARKLSNSIDRASDKYKVPANVLAAISMLESSYVLDAVNPISDDYGLFQINTFNIKAYKFNIVLLLTDLDYSVDSGAKVFQWFYKTYDTLEEAVKRFNAGTAKGATRWKQPIKYWKIVKTYM